MLDAASAPGMGHNGGPDMPKPEIEYRRPKLYPKQLAAMFDPRDVDNNPARYSFIEATTKAGKTVSGMAWLFEQAWMHGGPGRNYWWVAPVYAQAHIAFGRLKRGTPPELFKANNQNLTITLANGSVIWFKTGEKPDNLYGEDVYAAVIDEASRVRESAWHAVRSTLTATRGPLRAIGNVKGRGNWFFRLARQAESGAPNMGYYKLTAFDAANAGVLSWDEINDAKAVLPEAVFNELYLAIPSDDESNPFGLQHIRNCLIKTLSQERTAACGIDLARKRNWSVIIALDRRGQMTGIDRFRESWKRQEERIITLTKRWPTLIDATGVGDVFYERLKEKHPNVEGFVFTARSKQALMEGLAVAIQNGEVGIIDDGSAYSKALINELENFTFLHTTRGGVVYTAPEGMDDDCVMALALAVEQRRRIFPTTVGGVSTDDMIRVSPWLGGDHEGDDGESDDAHG